jgi:putative PIN family toxin of toxin-antitoxin system
MARALAQKLGSAQGKQWLQILQQYAATPESGHSNSRYRVVLDTNVWASGLLSGGNAEEVIRLVLSHHELVCSDYIVDELAKYLKSVHPRVSRVWLRQLWLSLDRYCVPVDIDMPSEIRDPKDEPVAALAAATGAMIVTGDKDFLEHEGDLGVPVVTVGEALQLLA